MGNKHSRRSDKTGAWDAKKGCKHYNDDTLITKQEWKTVPMTGEETKMVLRRMTTIAENL